MPPIINGLWAFQVYIFLAGRAADPKTRKCQVMSTRYKALCKLCKTGIVFEAVNPCLVHEL